MKLDPSIVIDCPGSVYAPSEDTFQLLDALEVSPGETVLEMGCGSGFISLHMAKAGAKVTAVDLSFEAAVGTKAAAGLNGLHLDVIRSDLFENVEGMFSTIIFNPPYLRGTSDEAEDLCWAGGPTGTEVLGRFLEQAARHLEREGRIVVLVSSDMEQGALRALLASFRVRTLSTRTVFFEELRVLELRP